MKNLVAVVSVCLAAQAGAASGPTPSPASNTIRTTSLLADGGSPQYFVDTRGSDSNTCTQPFTDGGSDGPCLTHQGTINKIPKVIRHGVTVRASSLPDGGQANYPCFYVSGFQCDVGFQQASSGLLFDGDLVNDTVATGTATGTATAVSAGGGGIFGTLDDSSQAWTVNDLTGKLIVILTGAGAGNVKPISSNTATAITVTGSWGAPVPTAGNTYAIVKPGWNVNTSCSAPATPFSATGANNYAIGLYSNNCNQRVGAIGIRNFGVSVTAGTGLAVLDSSQYEFRQFKISTAGTNSHGITTASGPSTRIEVRNGSFTSSSNTAFAVQGSNWTIFTLNNVLSYGSSHGGLWLNTIGVGSPSVNMTNCEAINAASSPVQMGGLNPARQLISATKLGCNSSSFAGAVVGLNSATSTSFGTFGATQLFFSQVEFKGSCGTAIRALGPGVVIYSSQLSGVASSIGLLTNWGARFHMLDNPTIVAPTEYSLDDGTGGTGTFASIGVGTCVTSPVYGSRFCK